VAPPPPPLFNVGLMAPRASWACNGFYFAGPRTRCTPRNIDLGGVGGGGEPPRENRPSGFYFADTGVGVLFCLHFITEAGRNDSKISVEPPAHSTSDLALAQRTKNKTKQDKRYELSAITKPSLSWVLRAEGVRVKENHGPCC